MARLTSTRRSQSSLTVYFLMGEIGAIPINQADCTADELVGKRAKRHIRNWHRRSENCRLAIEIRPQTSREDVQKLYLPSKISPRTVAKPHFQAGQKAALFEHMIPKNSVGQVQCEYCGQKLDPTSLQTKGWESKLTNVHFDNLLYKEYHIIHDIL